MNFVRLSFTLKSVGFVFVISRSAHLSFKVSQNLVRVTQSFGLVFWLLLNHMSLKISKKDVSIALALQKTASLKCYLITFRGANDDCLQILLHHY